MNDDDRLFLKIGLIGALIGMLLGNGIAMIFGSHDGNIVMVAPELSDSYGMSLAIILQTVVCGVLGFLEFAATRIYYTDKYNLLQQTLAHMTLSMILILSAAYFLHWIDGTVFSLVLFLVLIVMMYFFIWFSNYISSRIQVQRINELIEERHRSK